MASGLYVDMRKVMAANRGPYPFRTALSVDPVKRLHQITTHPSSKRVNYQLSKSGYYQVYSSIYWMFVLANQSVEHYPHILVEDIRFGEPDAWGILQKLRKQDKCMRQAIMTWQARETIAYLLQDSPNYVHDAVLFWMYADHNQFPELNLRSDFSDRLRTSYLAQTLTKVKDTTQTRPVLALAGD